MLTEVSSNDQQKVKPLVRTARAGKSDNLIPELIDESFEKTVRETGVDADSQLNPWNADDLYQKAGGYRIYDNMLKDDQVSVALAIKKDLIIGSGFHIVCEGDDQQDIRTSLECALNDDPDTPFEDSLLELLTAYDYGFSVSEKQFKLKEDGSLTLKAIKTRSPIPWLFHQDVYGNIVRYEQQGTNDKRFQDIDPNALLHFVNNSRFGNPYGTSDLRVAYQAYFIKTQIVKFYAIFLEKAASPIPTAKYDKSATDQEVDQVYNVIKRFQTSTAIAYPDNFALDFLETKGDHGKSYIDGINMMNMFIGRALFVPDLLGFQGGPTTGGSQALGREQMVVFFKHIMRRRRIVENLINKHIIKPIVTWNFGPLEKFPKFKLKPIEDVQAERNARLWLEAVKGRVYTPTPEEINHFKKICEFPESDDDELEEMDPIDEINSQVEEPEEKTTSQKSEENRERFAEKKYDVPEGTYHEKTDFSAIEKQLDSDQDLLVTESTGLVDEIFAQFSQDIQKLRPNDVDRLDKLNRLKLRAPLTRKLSKLLNKSFNQSFDNSQKLAQKEVRKSAVEKFAILPPDKFLETLLAENDAFVSDLEDNVIKATRARIIAAVKDGLPIQPVLEEIKGTVRDETLRSIERYSRTKFTEVMNKGRLAFFESTGAVAGYQFAAVLDDRTTPICEGLHGKKFKAGDEPVPPLHWFCRSTLIPITIYEEFEPDSEVDGQDVNQFIKENKAKGFAKQ